MTKEDFFNKTASFISMIHDFEIQLSSNSQIQQVTDLQFSLLKILYFSGSHSTGGLSRCLNINLPNTSREVKKMVLEGYVQKEVSAVDRRIVQLSLTGQGQELMDRAFTDMMNRFFDESGEWPEDRMKKCLKSMELLSKEIFNPIIDR